MTQRTLAIGDIHGCATALTCLLDAIQPTRSDTIVQLGDVIDRGTQSREAVETLMSLATRSTLVLIRGNHEELLLDALDDASKIPRWLRNGGTDTLRCYGCDTPAKIPRDHLDFIRSSIDYFETDRNVFIHAGYVEDQPMASQSGLALRWRVTNENCRPHCSGKTIISGHTAQKSGEILNLGYVKCIDTDCVHGGWLTAIDVDSGQIWQSDKHGTLR